MEFIFARRWKEELSMQGMTCQVQTQVCLTTWRPLECCAVSAEMLTLSELPSGLFIIPLSLSPESCMSTFHEVVT